MSQNIPVLTIDGPGASGKGTISRRVAQKLGWHYLDSGALYRLTALSADRHGVDLADESAVTEIAENLDVRFEPVEVSGELVSKVYLGNDEVTDIICTEEYGGKASQVAQFPAVRSALLERQRAFRQMPGLVADGRDMGTVVFPEAKTKVFLLASAEERANRRYKQLKEKGMDASLSAILAEIEARDERDQNRRVSPLIPAEDAVVIQTTHLSIEQVEQQVLALI